VRMPHNDSFLDMILEAMTRKNIVVEWSVIQFSISGFLEYVVFCSYRVC